MGKKVKIWIGSVVKSILAGLFVIYSNMACADRFGLQIATGTGDHHVQKLDLGVVWDPNLTWWEIGQWHFALIGEAHAAWWHTDEANAHRDVGEFGLTPILRFIKGGGPVRPFIEAGLGVRVLTSPTVSTDYKYSTAFQFSPMAGVGVQFGDRQQYQLGYRFQHISNGGIKEPNPGINFHQAYLQYNF